jgi:DNA replication protein DnaC
MSMIARLTLIQAGYNALIQAVRRRESATQFTYKMTGHRERTLMTRMELKKLAHELRLYGVLEHFERRCAEAANEGLSGEELLTRIFEDEKQYRKNKLTKSLETRAKFRRESLLEHWDTSFERGLTKTKIRELASLGFWHAKKNLIIVGQTGSGKTQLSIALGRAACQMQLRVLFLSVNQFFEEASAQRASGKFILWKRKMETYDIIILDDFGLRSYSHEEAVYLTDFVEERYQKRVHIISSQCDIEGWRTLFEDPVIGDALIDRLKNPSEKIKLTGGSYREKLC